MESTAPKQGRRMKMSAITLATTDRMGGLVQDRGVRHLAAGLKLTADAHEFLDGLRRAAYIPKNVAASNIIRRVAELSQDEPDAVVLFAYEHITEDRQREAARKVVELLRAKFRLDEATP